MFLELLDKGGIVMIILLILSIYTVAISVYKFIQYFVYNLHSDSHIESILICLRNGKLKEAENVTNKYSDPVTNIFKYMFSGELKKLDEAEKIILLENEAEIQTRKLEKFLPTLDLIANMAPLMGLLGTVIGIVKSFAGIATLQAGVDPVALAGGIWEALLTTIAGLVVALIALVSYYFVDAYIEKARFNMQNAITKSMHYLKNF